MGSPTLLPDTLNWRGNPIVRNWLNKLNRFLTALHRLITRRTFPHPLDLLRYLQIRHLSRFQAPQQATLQVFVPNAGCVPVTIRGNTTDANVLWETFVEGHYHRLDAELAPNCTILDLGSNIGLTCLDFAHTCKARRVVGVEMAHDNFLQAQMNCRHYPQIEILEGAVWSTSGKVSYLKSDGEWGYSVQEGSGFQADSYSLTEIFEKFSLDHVHFAKIDIEGAEAEIFHPERADLSWLKRVERLQIELHPPVSYEELRKVLESQGFKCRRDFTNAEYILASRD